MGIIVIVVGIIAGSSLVALVIYIILKREQKDIKWNDLIMVGLATVLIVSSQFSEISVPNILTLRKEIKEIKDDVAKSSNKVKELITTVGTSETELKKLQKTVGTSEAKLEKFSVEMSRKIHEYESAHETLIKELNRILKPIRQPKIKPEPRPDIRPEHRPEIRPEPQPDIRPETPPELMPKPQPDIRPEHRLETLPYKK